jgi:hypothetical protein
MYLCRMMENPTRINRENGVKEPFRQQGEDSHSGKIVTQTKNLEVKR